MHLITLSPDNFKLGCLQDSVTCCPLNTGSVGVVRRLFVKEMGSEVHCSVPVGGIGSLFSGSVTEVGIYMYLQW